MGDDRLDRSTRVALLVVLVVVLGMFGAGPADAAQAPEYVSSFGPDGTSSTGFSHAGPIAVDQGTGDVYVIDAGSGTLLKFDEEGHPVPFSGSAPYLSGNELTGLSFHPNPGEKQVAVDPVSHRIYVTSENEVTAFEESGEPSEFTAGPGAGTNKIGGAVELFGVAVDQEGNIYASDFGFLGAGVVRIYKETGEPVTEMHTTGGPANIAVDTKGAVYVNYWLGNVAKFSPSQMPVSSATEYSESPFDPIVSYAVAVDPRTNDAYIAERGANPRVARYDESGNLLTTFAGSGEEGEISQSEGVAIEEESTRVFVSNFPSSGLSQVEIFQPIVAAPSIEAEFASRITSSSASLGARINPNTLPTEYRFEYGTQDCSVSACTSVPVGGASIGKGHEGIVISQAIEGLVASTTYHYRVIAQNSLGTTFGEDRTFTTQGASLVSSLIDGRVWEMVSPANKEGGVLVNPARGPMQAAANGDGIAYQSVGSIEADPAGNRASERSTILSTRRDDGWHSKDITPPHGKPTLIGPGNEYNVFSADLLRTLVEPLDDYPLSSEASATTPYLRENLEPPVYRPLVTAKEGFANVPPETEFGGPDGEIHVSGTNRSLTHVVVNSEAPLTSGAESLSLYEWSSDGSLRPVSVLPEGGGGTVVDGILGSGQGSVQNAISADGSRIFWSQGRYDQVAILTTALYLRDQVAEETIRLDTVQGGSGLGESLPAFQGANTEGDVAFFSDTQQLTPDASPEGRDLYRCVVTTGAGSPSCSLTDITAPRASSGESAGFLGLVSGMSEDGTRVYFVARGILNPNPNASGQTAQAGQPNLYLWEEGTGNRFIATLSAEDHSDWGIAGGNAGIRSALSTTISPDGRYLGFMTERSLTGYENRDVSSGLPDQEIFRYDAVSDEVICASCNPTGASPEGVKIHVDAGFALTDPQGIWQDRWVAAALPEARTSPNISLYQPRAVMNTGRMFFNSADSLVPADSNRTWDIYQYEPEGMGTCSAALETPTVAHSGNGCVGLVSSGTGEESGFLDASASGDDVFFLSPSRLSALDTDTIYDVYDARVNGQAAVLPTASECTGGACQSSVANPSDSSSASEAFHGPGNVRTCPRGKRKVNHGGRVRCVKRKRRDHKHRKNKQHRGASKEGGARR